MLRLGYAVIFVPDIRDTVAFYEAAFGLRLRYLNPTGQYAEMETGDTLLAFTSESLVSDFSLISGVNYYRNRSDQAPAGAQLAFVTDDLDQAIAQAVAAGAVLVTQADAKPWGQTLAYLRDLNGVLVELCTPAIR